MTDLPPDDEQLRHIATAHFPTALPPLSRRPAVDSGKKGIVALVTEYSGPHALTSDERALLQRSGIGGRLHDLFYGDLEYGDAGAPLMAYINKLPKTPEAETLRALVGCLIARELIAATPPQALLVGGTNKVVPSIDRAESKDAALEAAKNLVAQSRQALPQTATGLKDKFAAALEHNPNLSQLAVGLRHVFAQTKVNNFQRDLRAEMATPQVTQPDGPRR